MNFVLTYVALWFGLLGLAIANGGLRGVYLPSLGEHRAQQLSVFTAVAIFFVYTWLMHRRFPIPSDAAALGIGLMWAAMTVAFEFFMVTVLMRKPASAALAMYDLRGGNLWTLVILATAVLPWIVHRLQRG